MTIELSLLNTILLIYILFVNIFTFFIFGIDKMKSRHTNKRRIAEKKLWFFCLIGGSLGGLLAMKFFRHKTKKVSFQSVLILILALQIGLIFFIINKAY
jgi:uncharacterized membrane protein YsdA (DUF1294 family)